VIGLERPRLTFAVHEDGSLEVTSPWFPAILIHRDVVATADGRRLVLRGDDLEIRCTNGGALYQLGLADRHGFRRGRLLRSWR